MASWFPAMLVLMAVGNPPLDAKMVQVAPARWQNVDGVIVRSPGQERAVVLIEGLDLHPFRRGLASVPLMRPWQKTNSVLVKSMAPDADVFAFSYSQVAPVTDIADVPTLGESVIALRKNGYQEIVLLGYSAGGLIARQFVEDNPDSGVTRVIQVCSPNDGSALAKLRTGVGAIQKSFVQSLSKPARERVLESRRDKRIPDRVEFACVVGNGLFFGDGLVSTRSQWPDDLQAQGIPALVIDAEHWDALARPYTAQMIARMARERQPRWSAQQVAALHQRLWPKGYPR